MVGKYALRVVAAVLAVCWMAALPRQEASGAEPLNVAVMEPSQLKGELGSWIILDARPVREWLRERIPGAQSFSWEDHILRPGGLGNAYQWPPPDRLASALGGLGISELSPVVIYGDSDRSWGGEGWALWVISWLGHQGPVRLIRGGIQSWRDEGYPVASGPETAQLHPLHYTPTVREKLNARADELNGENRPWLVIDTRSSVEWWTGRIPDAIHIPWTEFFTGRERSPISGEELDRLLRRNGVDPALPMIFYCTAGVRSAYAWMVVTLAGSHAARNYSGGMTDWVEFTRRTQPMNGA